MHGLVCALERSLQVSRAKPSDQYTLVPPHRDGETSCSRDFLVLRLDIS